MTDDEQVGFDDIDDRPVDPNAVILVRASEWMELEQQRDTALAERHRIAAEWGLSQIHLKKARAVVRSADRFRNCLGEFGVEGIGYCSEWLEALDVALLEYAVFESEKALEAE